MLGLLNKIRSDTYALPCSFVCSTSTRMPIVFSSPWKRVGNSFTLVLNVPDPSVCATVYLKSVTAYVYRARVNGIGVAREHKKSYHIRVEIVAIKRLPC